VRYADGNEARIGDVISIDDKHRGTVVACVDRSEYSNDYPSAQWSYLGKGILVDTDFGGVVHYSDARSERMVLMARENDL
jgi:hypothetical protein